MRRHRTSFVKNFNFQPYLFIYLLETYIAEKCQFRNESSLDSVILLIVLIISSRLEIKSNSKVIKSS